MMGRQIGSQYRETLEEAGYQLISWSGVGDAILLNPQGQRELWFHSDDHAGYVIELPNGVGYEFARSLPEEGK